MGLARLVASQVMPLRHLLEVTCSGLGLRFSFDLDNLQDQGSFQFNRVCYCSDFYVRLSETEASNNIVFEVEHMGDSSDTSALQVLGHLMPEC